MSQSPRLGTCPTRGQTGDGLHNTCQRSLAQTFAPTWLATRPSRIETGAARTLRETPNAPGVGGSYIVVTQRGAEASQMRGPRRQTLYTNYQTSTQRGAQKFSKRWRSQRFFLCFCRREGSGRDLAALGFASAKRACPALTQALPQALAQTSGATKTITAITGSMPKSGDGMDFYHLRLAAGRLH